MTAAAVRTRPVPQRTCVGCSTATNKRELVRIVRSPGVFPMPDVPIIMLSGHGERWRVVEAVRLGVHEYLIKPVSAKALYDRLVSIMMQPRPLVQLGDYYGPEPRKLISEDLDDAPIVETPSVATID